jgi:type VI secretion system protein ImpF
MAELAPRERLQPSLLDRLTDDEPDQEVESRERRVLSVRNLANTVLNYGMPDMSGASLANMNAADLERAIRQAIWDFEPRLIRSSVSVKVMPQQESISKIMFEIQADMWAQPYPERLFLKTELDLDLAQVSLTEFSGARS